MKKHAFFQQTGSCFREEAAPFVIMGKRCVLGNLGGRGALHHPGSMSFFWVLRDDFSFGAWLRRPGGQGGFRPPPYAPLDPLYPLQTAEGYPRTPPCTATGTSPCLSTDRVRIGHAIWFGLGPATNRVPRRTRTLHGPDAEAHPAAQGPCRGGPMPTLQG